MSQFNISGKKVLILGVAKSGISAAKIAVELGADVTLNDLQEKPVPEQLLTRLKTFWGSHPIELLTSHDIIILSPGIPPLKQIDIAREHGVKVIGEVEFTLWYTKARIAAVTGTNGKSTTVSLLGAFFEKMSSAVFTGGNLGTPFSETLLTPLSDDDALISLELSSFQLETISSLNAEVVALLNLTEDHLDRYADFNSYVDAKCRIFNGLKEDGFAIVNLDDPLVMKCIEESGVKYRTFSVSGKDADFRRTDNYLEFNGFPGRIEISDIPLAGKHNQANVLAAAGSALMMGATLQQINDALKTFKGLPHRMEYSGTVRNITFYNDSKATNVGSVIGSLGGFENNYVLIMGGRHKGASYKPLGEVIKGRCKKIIAIGESAQLIENDLKDDIPVINAQTLEEAVETAFKEASSGESVILSPACSSYDMFENYNVRGSVFMDAVRNLQN
ncbi:MAG: UDP-N-acetylmuramoyl-L-alanine--D-glutamate ligase [Deltaproteobacteria bacterium]|nr:UDP-N-acetylmuramoyl-L-alanine--D-glutamate ligase [Deltaproteobacteria bacterium]